MTSKCAINKSVSLNLGIPILKAVNITPVSTVSTSFHELWQRLPLDMLDSESGNPLSPEVEVVESRRPIGERKVPTKLQQYEGRHLPAESTRE